MTGLLLLTALLWKHAFADLFLQTFHGSVNKSNYFGNGQRHYIEHGVLTFCIVIFFTDWTLALALALLDYILHWQIDFAKSWSVKKFSIDRQSKLFWRIQAIDQFFHYLTYSLITLLVLII